MVVDDEEVRGKPEVKERWMNLAPVKDFCVVADEGGGVVSADSRSDTFS